MVKISNNVLLIGFLSLFLLLACWRSSSQSDLKEAVNQAGGGDDILPLAGPPAADAASRPNLVTEGFGPTDRPPTGASEGALDDTDIKNPRSPPADQGSSDSERNTIARQRRLLKEYQSYIKNLRGECCRRMRSGRNLLDNPLSNKHWQVRPHIAGLFQNSMYLKHDDFSNIMTLAPDEAGHYKTEFYKEKPPEKVKIQGLAASERYPMYQRNFDRQFVSRTPDPPNLVPFKTNPQMEWPGMGSYCPASQVCPAIKSPPWTTLTAFQQDQAGRSAPPPPYTPNTGETAPGKTTPNLTPETTPPAVTPPGQPTTATAGPPAETPSSQGGLSYSI